ncbi:hypothetical protein OG390_39350 [Streptomyces sp. NBC_00996]|nr:hypothetical protein OG390_39350 [Streptomyces sp. NBC_00996]
MAGSSVVAASTAMATAPAAPSPITVRKGMPMTDSAADSEAGFEAVSITRA